MTKNNDTRKRLQSVIGQLIDLKQDKIKLIPALVGTYDDLGNEIVDVPNRLGFIYCRIGGDFSELVQVFNESSVFPEFDLKVLIFKEPNLPFYKLYGRDLAQYAQWDNTIFLPFHGNTHSFGSGDNEGSDPVFIFKRQILQPMAVIPTSTGSMRAFVEPDYYSWNGVIQYFEGSETVDFTSSLPSEGARFITVYLNGNTNTLAYKTGSTFNGTDPTITGVNSYIPTVNLSEGIALASVYLEFNTSEIDWDSLYDLRNFLNDGGASTGLGLHTLDPIGGYHSGTLRSSLVTVLDTANYFTGSVVEDVLAELYNRTLAAGISGTLPILDDSVFKVTGTSISFDDSLGVVVTGSRAYISFTGSTASKINVLDTLNYFTETNVETVLAELYTRTTGSISAFTLIQDSKLITGTASFDFINIPQTYKHLFIVGNLRGDVGSVETNIQLRVNNVSTINYYDQFVQGGGATASAAETLTGTFATIGKATAGTSSANTMGKLVMFIPDYTDIGFSPGGIFLSFSNRALTTASFFVRAGGFLFNVTGAVTRLTIFPSSGNWIKSNRMSLYGMN